MAILFSHSHRGAKPAFTLAVQESTRRAFTLVEMLISVAIIAALVVLLLPTVQNALAEGRGAKATGTLRQIGVTSNLYANDHDNRFPTTYNGATGWRKELAPYVFPSKPISEWSWNDMDKLTGREKDLFEVPEHNRRKVPPVVSIGFNAYMNPSRGVMEWNPDPSLIKGWDHRRLIIPNSSQIILAIEMEEYNGDTCGPFDDGPPGTPGTPGLRRNGKKFALAAFCDAHVEALNRDALTIQGKTSTNNRWNWWGQGE